MPVNLLIRNYYLDTYKLETAYLVTDGRDGMPNPFNAKFDEIQANPELYTSAVISQLNSNFLEMPLGEGFIDYTLFQNGYEELKRATSDFTDLTSENIIKAIRSKPLVFIVLRSILGFTPSEWAYVTTAMTGREVTQTFVRNLDRRIRIESTGPLEVTMDVEQKIKDLVLVACKLINHGAPLVARGRIHRLDKIDTKHGVEDMRLLAANGVPYSALLYERFLGRPFASHRDSTSEVIGNVMEAAVKDLLEIAGVNYYETGRGEKIKGFDQAPDFLIPDKVNPKVVIEAKIAEDDGTARDKVTRIQHLDEISQKGQLSGGRRFEVIACIDGRGFGVRASDMKKILLATRGKVFTFKTLPYLVEYTDLHLYKTR